MAELPAKLPDQEKPQPPYSHAALSEKLKEQISQDRSPRIAFLDIDATLTGNPEEALKVRSLLDQQGYAVVFVTSRTEEMVMSRASFEASDIGRPAPHLKKDESGEMVEAFADEVPEFAGLYDPDVIASSTGSQIFVRQTDGKYVQDKDFFSHENDEFGDWREKTEMILDVIDPKHELGRLSPIEDPENFESGKTDVYPPDTRIQINFEIHKGAHTFEERRVLLAMKEEYERKIRELADQEGLDPLVKEHLRNIRITDDSNPEKGKYSIYLTPNKGYKARAAENVVENACKELGIDREKLETLMVGDSFPDVAMGLYAGVGTRATFLIVGGSRLTHVFTDLTVSDFAGVGLKAISARLYDKGNGEMGFVEPALEVMNSKISERRVVVGDVAYPGLKGPETIAKFLEGEASS